MAHVDHGATLGTRTSWRECRMEAERNTLLRMPPAAGTSDAQPELAPTEWKWRAQFREKQEHESVRLGYQVTAPVRPTTAAELP